MSEQDFGAECAELIWKSTARWPKLKIAKIINDQLARRRPAPEPVAGEWSVEVEEMAREFTVKCNVCTYAGIYNLALPLFAELSRFREVLIELDLTKPATFKAWEKKRIAVLTPAPAPASSEVK